MNCGHARKHFGDYWDDELTQAEREWLESHFTTCDGCRGEYEIFSRSLELVGSLPRHDAAPDLAERVLARARRATAAPDRVPSAGMPWVPVTAAAAVLLIAGTLLAPMLARTPGWVPGSNSAQQVAVREPVLVQQVRSVPTQLTQPGATAPSSSTPTTTSLPADSLFDHSQDVEFILDAVTLRRGQATVSQPGGTAGGERAVVSF